MPVRIGDATPSRFYVGDAPVLRRYAGDTLVWSAGVNDGDSFNRADGDPGSNWSRYTWSSGGILPVIFSNTLRNAQTTASNTNNQSAALFTKTPAATNDHMVRATLVSAQNDLYSGLILAASADFQNMVLAMLTTTTAKRGIWTVIGGTFTRRVGVSTAAIVAGDVAGFKAQGSTYTLVRNPDGANTTVASWTDSGGLFTRNSSRRLGGLFLHSERTFSASNYSPAWDDFNIRDLV